MLHGTTFTSVLNTDNEYGDSLPAEAQFYFRRMQEATAGMLSLINDLLMLSRVSTHSSPFKAVDLRAILHDVLSDLEVADEDLDLQPNLDSAPVIEADPTQMRQLFQNLLSNAIKYRREPERLRISVPAREVKTADGSRIELRVEDNGIGFDPKYADRIFGAFQRLHGRSVSEGTGMGLAICRRIAERHGGSIRAEGKLNGGSVFTNRTAVTSN